MKAKHILKNIVSLLGFLLSGISTGVAVTEYLFDTLPLMDQSTVPENPVAIIIIPFLALCLSVFATAILAIGLLGMRKNVRLSLLLFHKKESKVCIAIRIIGYLIISRLIYEGISDWFEFRQFFVSGLWYYASAVIFILLGMIIFLSIITKEVKYEKIMDI